VLQLTGRSFMVGVTSAALFVPILLLAMTAGRLADRFDRRRLVIATQVVAMIATGVLAVLAGTDQATATAVIVVAAIVGVQYAVSIPTMGALLPALVPRDRLGEAVGLNSVTYNLARVVGPVVATAAIAGLGFGWVFGINSISFVALIVALALLRFDAPPRATHAGGPVREAMAVAWRDRRLRLMLVSVAAVSIAADPVVTLSPAFAEDVFGRADADAGLIVAAFGIGAIACALLFVRLFRAPSEARLRRALSTMVAGTRPLAALVDGAVADWAGPRVAVLVVLIPLLAVALLAMGRFAKTRSR